ncbi:hypothetical protein ACFQES_36240 [Nonomuraea salmonea]|uniref:hypothetical protein n=1 Tax=Nonomuraea salmonea TaxID=46181 RepID=UPI00361D51F6
MPSRSKATARNPAGSPTGSITHRLRSVTWASSGLTAATSAPVRRGNACLAVRWSSPVKRPSSRKSGAVSPARQP